nr:MAG TPA: hypothetical protein [Inoviridae sp.]
MKIFSTIQLKKRLSTIAESRFYILVGVTGFEPTTSTTPSPRTKCAGRFLCPKH